MPICVWPNRIWKDIHHDGDPGESMQESLQIENGKICISKPRLLSLAILWTAVTKPKHALL